MLEGAGQRGELRGGRPQPPPALSVLASFSSRRMWFYLESQIYHECYLTFASHIEPGTSLHMYSTCRLLDLCGRYAAKRNAKFAAYQASTKQRAIQGHTHHRIKSSGETAVNNYWNPACRTRGTNRTTKPDEQTNTSRSYSILLLTTVIKAGAKKHKGSAQLAVQQIVAATALRQRAEQARPAPGGKNESTNMHIQYW